MTFASLESDDDSKSEKDRLLNKKQRKETDPEKRAGSDEKITNWERISQAVKKRLKKDGLRLIILVVLNGLYLYFGGLIFYLLEKTPDVVVDNRKHVQMILTSLKVSQKRWTILVIKKIDCLVASQKLTALSSAW